MKILSGVYTPDAGEIVLDGRTRAFTSPMTRVAPASKWCTRTSRWCRSSR